MAPQAPNNQVRVAARLANGFALDLVKLGGFGRDVIDGLLMAAISQANVAQVTRNPDLQRAYATLDQPPQDPVDGRLRQLRALCDGVRFRYVFR